MPELPEVTALAGALNAQLRGATIDSVSLRSVAALKTFDPPLDALVGRTVSRVTRLGKFIDLELPPLHLVFHLARAGWLRLRDQAGNARPSLRGPLLMIVSFAGGRVLEATEHGKEKRLAVYVVREVSEIPGVARLGVDALSETLTPELLGSLLEGESGTLKNVLADQAVLAGIGNAYSDEILHAARLSPFRKAAGLGEDGIASLHGAIRRVLADAVDRAAAVDPAALKGDKRERMQVHGRTGEPCLVCGDLIREVSYSSRSFQYCPTCQTGGKVYADRRMSRLLR